MNQYGIYKNRIAEHLNKTYSAHVGMFIWATRVWTCSLIFRFKGVILAARDLQIMVYHGFVEQQC